MKCVEACPYGALIIVGKPISIIVPKRLNDEVRDILNKVKRGKKVEHYETARVRKDGEEITVSITVSPIKEGGKIVGASTIARDVTEQKKAEWRKKERTWP